MKIDKKTVAPSTDPNPTIMPLSIERPRNFHGCLKIFITSMCLSFFTSVARRFISRAGSSSKCRSVSARRRTSFTKSGSALPTGSLLRNGFLDFLGMRKCVKIAVV